MLKDGLNDTYKTYKDLMSDVNNIIERECGKNTTMRIKDLSEGVIQVPDELVDYVTMITKKFLKGYIYCNFHKGLIHELEKTMGFFSTNKNYLVCDFEDASGEYHTYDVDVSNVKYTDKTTDTLGIGIAYQNSTTNAMFLPDRDAILINLFHFIKNIEPLKQDSDDAKEIMMRYELVDAANRIPEIYESFVRRLRSIIKHELAHFIQFKYLADKSEKQISTDGEYHQQFAEYSPWIITSIENIKLAKDVINIKELVNFVIGVSDIEPKGLLFSGHSKSILNSRSFFRKLKDHNPKQWKKAVKYLINELYIDVKM